MRSPIISTASAAESHRAAVSGAAVEQPTSLLLLSTKELGAQHEQMLNHAKGLRTAKSNRDNRMQICGWLTESIVREGRARG